MSAALPLRVYPPLFNRYGEGMGFGDHIDNAIRISPVTGARYRTDLSCTLFLTDPDEYDGGELVIDDGLSPRGSSCRPATWSSIRPAPSTGSSRSPAASAGRRSSGCSRWWPTRGQRALLHDLDQAIIAARADLGDDHPAAVALVGVYHNLIRMWSQV